MRAKTLVIGLDSADRQLVWELQEAGRLPVIRSLIRRGRWGILQSPPGMGDDSTWASFATCAAPGRHGRYFYKQLRPGTYATPWFRDRHLQRAPFWKTLSAGGQRVGVMDVPKSPLCRVDNGFQLADWLVHGRDGDTRSSPEGVARDVVARFGDDTIDRLGTRGVACDAHALSEDLRPEFERRVLDGLRSKRAAAVAFLGRGGWDLFLVVFKEAHCIGHAFWHRVDESRRRDGRGNDGPRNPVHAVYRALDAAVGELLSLVDETTNVILFSDLGMSSNYRAEHLLDEALLRLERPFPRITRAVYPLGVRLEEKVRKRLRPGSPRSVAYWMRRAFQVEHNEMSGAIRINLRGREPSGRVRPEDLASLCSSLAVDLMGLTDPDTGQPVVDRVIRTHEYYPGEYRDHLPDLLVVWKRDRPISGLASKRVGVIRGEETGRRTGNHSADGFYVLTGPAVDQRGEGRPASIMDVGPTAAMLLGTQLPHVDGRPIEGIHSARGEPIEVVRHGTI